MQKVTALISLGEKSKTTEVNQGSPCNIKAQLSSDRIQVYFDCFTPVGLIAILMVWCSRESTETEPAVCRYKSRLPDPQ